MRTSSLLLPAAVAAAIVGLATSAGAQACAAAGSVSGTVRADEAGPLAGVEFAVAGVRFTSDSVGRFRATGICAGPEVLTARRLGYQAASWPVMVQAGTTLELDLVLTPMAQEIAPVVVRARAGGAYRLREFYMRRQRTAGHFLTREDLEPFENRRVTDALRARIPSVRIVHSSGPIRNAVRLRNQRCAPMVWLDGMSTPAGEFDLDVLETSGIAGIEVYAGPATIPVEFRTPFGRDGCGGAIVVWTRIGPDEWDDRREIGDEDVQQHLPIYAAEEVDIPAAVDTAEMMPAVYPDSARAFDLEGAAVVEFVVDTTGRPVYSSIRAVSASEPAFGAAAVRAVAFSRFVPARKNGQAVRQRMTLPFRFTTAPES